MDTNRLIGMRVMNTGNHAIGTIEYIRDGIVAVNYHGSVAKHSYPSAFSSILELEDEELQEELQGEGIKVSRGAF